VGHPLATRQRPHLGAEMALPQGIRLVAGRRGSREVARLASPSFALAALSAASSPAAPSSGGLAALLPMQRRHNSGSSLGSLIGLTGGAGGGGPNEGINRLAIAAPRWHVGVAVVPQQIAWVVERLGRFHKVLDPGLHFLIPFVDRIAYSHSLKEESIPIPNQQAITKDNVTISIDGVLFLRVLDPYQASYGVHEPIVAVMQLAQTTMRSEIGKMTLDKTFEERDIMNAAIVTIVNEAAQAWGLQVLRYEIRDITPPTAIKQAMEMQAEAERRRRAEVLQSEGDRQSEVNLAQGKRQAAILRAEGEAQAILERAKATAEGIRLLSSAISGSAGGEKAAALRVAEQYVAAWREMARTSNTIIVPANPNDASAMVATAMGIFRQVGGPELPTSMGGSAVPPADGRRAKFGADILPPVDRDASEVGEESESGRSH